MITRRSRTTLLVAGVMAVSAVGGCVPTPAAGVPREPVRGCRDHTGRPEAFDVAYSGEPSEYGNLTYWTSTDGSCTGRPVPVTTAASTLIVADGSANAAFLCLNLLATIPLPGTFDERTGPWSPALGGAGFLCAG